LLKQPQGGYAEKGSEKQAIVVSQQEKVRAAHLGDYVPKYENIKKGCALSG
jgi:hypothetical protein